MCGVRTTICVVRYGAIKYALIGNSAIAQVYNI